MCSNPEDRLDVALGSDHNFLRRYFSMRPALPCRRVSSVESAGGCSLWLLYGIGWRHKVGVGGYLRHRAEERKGDACRLSAVVPFSELGSHQSRCTAPCVMKSARTQPTRPACASSYGCNRARLRQGPCTSPVPASAAMPRSEEARSLRPAPTCARFALAVNGSPRQSGGHWRQAAASAAVASHGSAGTGTPSCCRRGVIDDPVDRAADDTRPRGDVTSCRRRQRIRMLSVRRLH